MPGFAPLLALLAAFLILISRHAINTEPESATNASGRAVVCGERSNATLRVPMCRTLEREIRMMQRLHQTLATRCWATMILSTSSSAAFVRSAWVSGARGDVACECDRLSNCL